jgi:hypothetical protein
MNTVPLQAVPNQTLQIVLDNQSCVLNLYQSPAALFMDVLVNDAPVVLGTICQNLNRIVRSLYLGFSGDFVFEDLQGTDDPDYSGLGTRFQLIYLTAAEAALLAAYVPVVPPSPTSPQPPPSGNSGLDFSNPANLVLDVAL